MTEPQFPEVLRAWTEVFMRRSMHEFRQFSRHSGLSMAQMGVLFHIYHGGMCGVSDVAGHQGVSNAAASQIIDRLVLQGMLERREDPNDRRAKTLALTPNGEALVCESIEARLRWVEQLTQAFSAEQQEAISAALTLLARAARELEQEKDPKGF
jgi:DNA-binding MarR family transcriptional regulator